MKEKWERERSERRAKMKKNSDKYNDRLLTDKAFAKHAMERHIAEKERRKQKKIDQKQKQQRDEDTEILFENFFGEEMIWGHMAVTYREKYHTAYVPIGVGRFSFQCQIDRKAYLYEVVWSQTTARQACWFLFENHSSDAISSWQNATHEQ